VSLENLLRMGQLKIHPPDADEIERLSAAAYKAIMQGALAALMLHGYRPETNRPGHHMTLVQSLPLTIGMVARRVAVLDAFRRQRNVADYTGDDIDASTTAHCITEASQLIDQVLAWRHAYRPALVPKPSQHD
jgi:hypothetical protein